MGYDSLVGRFFGKRKVEIHDLGKLFETRKVAAKGRGIDCIDVRRMVAYRKK